MKKIIIFLLFFISINFSYAQRLMIGYSKKSVIKEMRTKSDYKSVYGYDDYLEYSNGNKIIKYRFVDFYCTECSITMPKELEPEFIQMKEDCNCWLELKEDNKWVFKQLVDDKWVLIERLDDGNCVTFVYYLY